MNLALTAAGVILMKALFIDKWHELYETHESRKVRTLTFYAKSNKLVGEGIGLTLDQPDNMALLGTWAMIECLASTTSPKELRGFLVRNGTALTAVRMAQLTRVKEEYFARALEFFQQKTGWLVWRHVPGSSPGDGDTTATYGNVPGSSPGNIDKRNKGTKEGTEHGVRERGGGSATGLPSDSQGDGIAHGAIEIPDWPIILKFIQEHPGEPASGAPAIPKDFAESWHARMTGRERWPHDWKAKLVADWRVEFRNWGKTKKNAAASAAGSGATRERWQVEKDLKAVQEEIRTHARTNWPGNKPMPKKIVAEFEELVRRQKDLDKELKA